MYSQPGVLCRLSYLQRIPVESSTGNGLQSCMGEWPFPAKVDFGRSLDTHEDFRHYDVANYHEKPKDPGKRL